MSPPKDARMSDARLDAALSLVADGQRRRIIRRLREDPTGATTLEGLLDDLQEADAARAPATRPDRDRDSLRLVHSHLPRLAEYGVVEYDRGEDVIRYQPDRHVEAVLDALPVDDGRTVPES